LYKCVIYFYVGSKSWLDILTSRENSELTQETTAKKKIFVNILRWYNFIKSNPIIAKTLDSLPNEVKSALTPVSGRSSMEKSNVGNRAREGKFVELPGAEMGKVVVRFPPEASGYIILFLLCFYDRVVYYLGIFILVMQKLLYLINITKKPSKGNL
jgi:hypothetical protein